MKTTLDEELRERYEDLEAGLAALEKAQAEAESWRFEWESTDDPVAHSNVGRWLQRASEYARLTGELEESLRLKEAALDVWAELDRPRATFLVQLQRALVLAELDRPAAADEMERLRGEMSGDETLEPFYLGFWLEYEARRRLWVGEYAGAEEALVQALAFRKEHRAARIIEHTERALAICRAASRRV